MGSGIVNALNRLGRVCSRLGYELSWYKDRSMGGLEISIRNPSKRASIDLYLCDILPVRRGLTDVECIKVLSRELLKTGLHKRDQKAVQELLGIWLDGLVAPISFFMKKIDSTLAWQDFCKTLRISLQYGISVIFPYHLASENPYNMNKVHWVVPPKLQLFVLSGARFIENFKQYKEGFKQLLKDALKPSVKLIPPSMAYEVAKKLIRKYIMLKGKDQRGVTPEWRYELEWRRELLNALKETLLILCAFHPKLQPLVVPLHFLD